MAPQDQQDVTPHEDPTRPHGLEDFDLISTYTAGQAVEDGMLVQVSKRDLVTIGLFTHLTELAPMEGPPPPGWPIPLVAFFKGRDKEKPDPQAVAAALCVGLIDAHRIQAQRIYDDNTGGGIYTGFVLSTSGRLSGFYGAPDWEKRQPAGGSVEGVKVWLMPNELGGMTFLFPSEY